MTVSSSTNRVSYSGNGTLTTFAYTFKVFDEGDLTVILRASDGTETVQTITTHYTVSGVGDAGGGNVTFVTAPTATETVVILREQPLTQGLDLVPNDPFPAASLEDALDKIVFMTQKHEEELGRAIKASRTNTLTGSEFTISAADRANKVFSFDASGDLAVTQELGVWQGNWATATTFSVRDIVKDASNNNVYICITAHTSSGSTPISTNTDSAKWALLVDAASATASAAAAAASETAAETAQTAAEAAQTAAETAQTAAETAETNAETAQAAAEAAQASAEAVYDNFDDRYLGAKSSDPTVDNDGDALIDGALYFDTTNNVMKFYDLGNTLWKQTTPTSAQQTNIDAAVADATDIGTVATNISSVNTVAGIDAAVSTVSGISAQVSAVAADATDIGTVATDLAGSDNIGTVATNIGNVNSVATNSTNINAVAGNATNINAVAADATDIGTVATDLAGSDTIGTVAAGIANINTVATDITNVNTVATNITGVNSFAERYRVEATNPTTSLDAGDLAYVTGDTVLKYYNGTSWQSISPGIGAVSDDSNPSLGGNLNLASNDITGTGNIDITGSITSSGAVIGSNNVVTAVASGALANGDVVCLNSDGTVSVASTSDTLHSTHEAEFATGNGIDISAAVDPTTGKILVLYNTDGTLYGRLVAGQINGKTITFGTPLAFNSTGSALYGDVVFDPNEKVFIVAYRDGNNSSYGTARVCTIDGLTVTAGSEVVFESAATILIKAVYDTSNEKVVITYRDSGNSDYGTAVVGTVSGGAITFGTPVVYESNFINHASTTFDSTNNKIVHVYEEGTTGYAIIGTVSGTSISFGTRVSFATGGSDDNLVVFDSNAGKVAVVYENSGYNGIVGTVSGTSISFGTAVNFSSDSIAAESIAFDASSNEIIVGYYEAGNDLLKVITGTISGTSITFGTAVNISSQTNTPFPYIVFDPTTNKNIVLYENSSSAGYGVVFETNYSSAEDYIGISNAAYSDGATATIQIVGSVDDAQSGLVEQASYFVADDGSLSLINNGRKIGKAISATELLIDTSMSGAETNAYLGSLI